MADEIPDEGEGELVSRTPEPEDLIAICRELNARGARYLVCGGFATLQSIAFLVGGVSTTMRS